MEELTQEKQVVTVEILKNFIKEIEAGVILAEEFSLEATPLKDDSKQLQRLSLIFTSSSTPEDIQKLLEANVEVLGEQDDG